MKSIALIFMLGIISISGYSQDKIIKHTGEGIKCKILREDSSQVYFTFDKKGREVETYINKSQIKEIIYENQPKTDPIFYKKEINEYVYYQNGDLLSKDELERILKSNPEAFKEFESSHENAMLALLLGGAGGGLVGYPVGTYIAGGDPNWNLALIGAGLVIVSLPIAALVSYKINHAVDIYNSGLKSSSIKSELRFGLNSHGIGFQLNF